MMDILNTARDRVRVEQLSPRLYKFDDLLFREVLVNCCVDVQFITVDL